jgi:H+/gluconate symporter-like permease
MGVPAGTGIWVGSIIYLAIALILGPIIGSYVQKRTKDVSMKKSNCVYVIYQNNNIFNIRLTFWLVFLMLFMMWVSWICCFMHQSYPLMRPIISMPKWNVTNSTEIME